VPLGDNHVWRPNRWQTARLLPYIQAPVDKGGEDERGKGVGRRGRGQMYYYA